MNCDEHKNFLDNYQYNFFQETDDDHFRTADLKRKCLMQIVSASNELANDNAVCDILSDKLYEYSELVDNQSKVNNYIPGIQVLIPNPNDVNCMQWKSKLNASDIPNINSLNCCEKNNVTADELSILLQPKVHEIETVDSPRNFNFKTAEERQPENPKRNNFGAFKTARDELEEQNAKKNNGRRYENTEQQSYGGQKKSLGARRGVQNKFIPPIRSESNEGGTSSLSKPDYSANGGSEEIVDERLKNIEPRMVELIKSEIMDNSLPISWDDIAGLNFAKTVIKEAVVWPLLRPDIFTGLRQPPKGILLFGPPGTGKTLIGKCIASQSQSTFFSISASSLTSKWIGDGEKMVRAMFAVARCYQPSVIFIDEIDSLLTQRSDTEHESSRRIKTEFLVQLDGATTGENDRILVIGATNRPQELDEAARRRFVKRLYIPLPEQLARLQIIQRLMKNEKHELSDEHMLEIADLSDGYSGADMKNLCAEASLGPIRSIDIEMMQNIAAHQVRPITVDDFRVALTRVRASVSQTNLEHYLEWDKIFGAGGW